MKGISSSQPAMTAYRRQTAVDPVSVPQLSTQPLPAQQPPSARSPAVSGTRRAARGACAAEARPAIAASDPAIDHAKVERLRTALDAGTLKIDSSLVAERLIDRDE